MSLRIIVMDHTPAEQLNLGNPDMANAWLRLSKTAGVEIWTTRELYNAANEATRRVYDKLGTHVPLQDNYVKGQQYKGSNARGVNLDDFAQRRTTYTAAALAMHLRASNVTKVEFMTTDADTAAAWRRLNGALVPEVSNIKPLPFDKKKLDYNQARRLLNLPPLNIDKFGRVLPNAPRTYKQVTQKPKMTIDGKPYYPHDATMREAKSTIPSNAQTVQQPKVPQNANLNNVKQPPKTAGGQVAAGRAAGVQLVIDGVGFTLGWINDEVQQRRFLADWEPKKRDIQQTMAKEPTTGALVWVYYSVMQGTRVFEYIRYTFGRTRHEAFKKFQGRSNMDGKAPGDLTNDEVGWFPPHKPIEPHLLPTPFPVEALATFAGGRDLVMDVKWKGKAGFDETGQTRVGAGAGLDPLFLVLSAPEEIPFNNGSLRQTAYIDLAGEYPAETDMPYKVHLTTVELDSAWNPFSGNTSAAMVYPAERYTETLFRKAQPIRNKGQLYYHGLDDVRFVEPENIRVIQDYRLFPPKR